MKDKSKYYHDVKNKIIVHILNFLDIKNPKYKDKAIELLTEYAKFRNVPLKRKDGLPKIKIHLGQFIINNEGYNTTINNIFNSLKN